MKRKVFLYGILALTLLLLPHHTRAAELITNGGFETGNFTGWTTVNPAASASPYYRQWQVSPSGFGGGYSPVPTATSVTQGSFNAWSGAITGGTGQEFQLFQQITIPVGRFVRFTWQDRYQVNYSICGTTCGTATYRVEITNSAGTLLQTLFLVNALSGNNVNTGWINHSADLTAYQGQTIRVRFRATSTLAYQGPGQLEVDAVSVQTLQTTAANVSVGGRVLTNEGMGISRAIVTLTDSAGNSRSIPTSSFGYYNFEDVDAGSTYTISVNSKRYSFPDSPRVVNVQENITDMNFIASPSE